MCRHLDDHRLRGQRELSRLARPSCFCLVPFLSGTPEAPPQQQAGPKLTAATCLFSSAAAPSLIATPALKLSSCCRPLPDLQHFSAVGDPGPNFAQVHLLPVHSSSLFPADVFPRLPERFATDNFSFFPLPLTPFVASLSGLLINEKP